MEVSKHWFPSPRGDKLKYEIQGTKRGAERFPSPYGDKLKWDTLDYIIEHIHEFPSPYGDKLQFMKANVKINTLL